MKKLLLTIAILSCTLGFAQHGLDLTKAILNNTTKAVYNPVFSPKSGRDPQDSYKMNVGGKDEDISWLLG